MGQGERFVLARRRGRRRRFFRHAARRLALLDRRPLQHRRLLSARPLRDTQQAMARAN